MKRSRLPRRTRLKAKGGSAFPHRRDRAFMAYLREQLELGVPCDAGCGHRAQSRAHLVPRSRGGDDRGNVVLLCDGFPGSCHWRQEKRSAAFCREVGVDLEAAAARWVARWQREKGV